MKGSKANTASWRIAPGRIAWMLLLAAAGARAFDLTPDRGPISNTLFTSNGYVSFNVWNIGSNDWGPFNNCGTIWADAQWRGPDGKRIGSVVTKSVFYQTDFNPLTNGWFTPNPKRSSGNQCTNSLISRGWDDEYSNSIPDPSGISHSIQPTLHARVDPNRVNWGDENPDNNHVWITTQWAGAPTNLFVPIDNMDLPAGTFNLTSGDSLFYGVYSVKASNGILQSYNVSRTTNLVHGNEMVGYQGRVMNVTVTSGITNTYTIQNGSRVQADFLGQNHF